ncbi:MAG: hypothetical protein M5U09_19175 [Gammaproteobacteria bacterium]|nr:hypothetical protein [Gammaproteobacteria bacterium]
MIETQTIVVRADGSVALPDLTDELASVAEALGGAVTAPVPAALGRPRLALAREIRLPVSEPGPSTKGNCGVGMGGGG